MWRSLLLDPTYLQVPRSVSGVVEHRTQAAAERSKELWCYHCDTMNSESRDRCVDLPGNTSDQHLQCKEERKMCMVRRISLQTSTENTTSAPSLWLLQRNCTKHCEAGCIIIGERIKLHSCTTCCDENFCNSGNKAGGLRIGTSMLFLMMFLTTVFQSAIYETNAT